ncbi:hypothetical protein HMPREF3044_05710 [Corynebacterium sp. HMSC073D01]|nr:hypothetical protein HMPREF3044_05710 [Corynebacterium sp. HMSC073D01]
MAAARAAEVLLERLGNLLERGAREISHIDGADGLEDADGAGLGCVEVNEDKGESILRRILQNRRQLHEETAHMGKRKPVRSTTRHRGLLLIPSYAGTNR